MSVPRASSLLKHKVCHSLRIRRKDVYGRFWNSKIFELHAEINVPKLPMYYDMTTHRMYVGCMW